MRYLMIIAVIISFISCSSNQNYRQPSDLASFEKNEDDQKNEETLYSQNLWIDRAGDRNGI